MGNQARHIKVAAMGTRTSRHNHGRKPIYKDVRDHTPTSKTISDSPTLVQSSITVNTIIKTPAYHSGLRLNQWRNWSPSDVEKLRILAEAGSPPEASGDALGRQEKSIAYKARDLGIKIPSTWAAFLPQSKYMARPRQPKILLCYPFMVKAQRDEHADLIAVNKLVPASIPDHMRGDICQDILLAIYEGRVNLTSLQRSPKLVKEYMNQWRNNNLENGGYGIMSLDPFGDDQRSLEERIAAQADWDYNQMNDARSNWESQNRFFHPATQFEEAYFKQITGEHLRLCDEGHAVTFEDVRERVVRGERAVPTRNLIAERIKIANCLKECGFQFDRIALNPSYRGKEARGEADDAVKHHYSHMNRSQYIDFKIPGSAIPFIRIRIGAHARVKSIDNTNDILLDSYNLGVDGLIKVLKELATNIEECSAIHQKTGDFYDVLQEIAV
jgi:hypothetical protein